MNYDLESSDIRISHALNALNLSRKSSWIVNVRATNHINYDISLFTSTY